MKKKIALCGTPDYCAEIFNHFLLSNNFEIQFVVTNINKNFDRNGKIINTEIENWCLKNNLKLYSVEKFNKLDVELFKALDAVFVFSFGQLIGEKFLNAPKFGFLNLHPSNLPEFRGPSPIQYTILSDKNYITLSIMCMNSKFDEGNVIAKKKIQLNKFSNINTAFFLIQINSYWIVETILLFLNKKIFSYEQTSKATLTKLIQKEDLYITNESASEIILKIRAYGFVYIKYKDYYLKCLSATIDLNSKFQINGISPIFIQKPGKKIIHIYHFLNSEFKKK